MDTKKTFSVTSEIQKKATPPSRLKCFYNEPNLQSLPHSQSLPEVKKSALTGGALKKP
jgi:hypothetical protein